MALTILSPAVGLFLYKPATASTMLSMYLANPAIAGGAAGGVLFGILAIHEWDRTARNRVDVLTDAVVSPLTAALTRLLALLAVAVMTRRSPCSSGCPSAGGSSARSLMAQTMPWPIFC